jgi:bifunctional non-homologous end joining protein LigD
MSLVQYKKKRSFKQTPEPTGGKTDKQSLKFVVQKHAASHLHYDFRLEMDDVLKSWAVPKGPSLDPKVKRLAMMVEDHPYDYRTFEGIIPPGNYGAGAVIVWDEGWYEPADDESSSDKYQNDKTLRHQLHKGKIKFILHGKKLKGTFTLVKAPGRGENSWLLMKLEDKYASSEDILLKDKSVISRKTVEQLKALADTDGKQSKRLLRPGTAISTAAGKTESTKKAVARKSTARKKKADTQPLVQAEDIPFTTTLSPMLATLVDKPHDKSGWIYEIKWDGYRALAFRNGGVTELKSRNDKSFNKKFYPIYDAVANWNINAILDGEIVVLNEHGHANFGALQNWRSEADGDLIYYIFDILWLNGKDLMPLSLHERRTILKQVVPQEGIIRLSETFDTTGSEFLPLAQQLGLEGIIAKRSDSSYHPGERTTDWLKIKANKRQEVVIGGYTINKGSSKPFSSLLVGIYSNGKLIYTGKIGTGFNDKMQREMLAQFKPLVTAQPPFETVPDINKPSRFRPNPPEAAAVWLKPKLVCEVSFNEMTSDGVMRHPSFEGMRVDKSADEVVLESETPVENIVTRKHILQEKKIIRPSGKKTRKTLLNPTDETQVREIDGHSIKFTNLSKLYWPEEHVSKRDMLNYYYQVAPYILPYLKDRPQSLNRFPNGIYGKSFYQKDVTGKVPEWVNTYLYHSSDEEDVDKHFLVVQEEASILLMASMGCIELNPWSSRIEKPDHPDWCIIDLDPDKNSFDQVIEAAQVTKQVLDSMNVPSYCKTSGSTGLHIYIPLGAKYTYEQSKEFGRMVATLVHREIPKYTSIERIVSNRNGKMYIDFLQNRPKATLAAPYSLRPKKGATVSMPLHWDEVKKGLKMTDFTIFNAMDRIKEVGDLFKPVIGKGIDLKKITGSRS